MSSPAKQSPPDGPAIVRTHHKQDRALGPQAGAAKGYRNTNEHPLTAAYALNRISADEFEAGDHYRNLYELRYKTGETKFEFSPGGGQNNPFGQTQIEAIQAIAGIEARLLQAPEGPRYKIIIQRLCGEGYEANHAVMAAGYDNPKQTWERTRLALNKLAIAISKARPGVPYA